MFEYNKICKELLESLPERTKMIIIRRFGLFGNEKETLEFIGKEHGVTRERVRQVERDGIKQIKKKLGNYSDVFSFFDEELERFGGAKKEESFVDNFLENGDCRNCMIFLLNVSDTILRFSENDETYSLWAKNKEILDLAREVIDEAFAELKKDRKLKSFFELKIKKDLTETVLKSYLEVSKRVICNEEGLYGLNSWPEINPKGIKDRAYLVLKKAGKPLHFRDVAIMLGEKANPQTTHNELIKDSRFVLVGRGVYALSEWGYTPGEVKEVIRGILIKEGALHKNDIIVKVEEQRIVKKNTIIQNLSNKKYFIRTPDGKYTVA
jgi:hypothetical protein